MTTSTEPEETQTIALDETVEDFDLDFAGFFSMQDNLIRNNKVNNMKGGVR